MLGGMWIGECGGSWSLSRMELMLKGWLVWVWMMMMGCVMGREGSAREDDVRAEFGAIR